MSTWKEGENGIGREWRQEGKSKSKREQKTKRTTEFSIQQFTGSMTSRKWTSEAQDDNVNTQKTEEDRTL